MGTRFTLLDAVYYDALLATTEALATAAVPSCLVGGGAAQAWVASLLDEIRGRAEDE